MTGTTLVTGTTVDQIEKRIRLALAARLSPARILHSEGVALLAGELCLRFCEPVASGRLAGLAHDLAREMSPAEIRSLATQDGGPLGADEEEQPVLLHGRAGAVLLAAMGVDDPAVLQAVRDHVTGRPGMEQLSSIVYVADFLEPGRGFLPETERLGSLRGSLAEMVSLVLRATVAYLSERGRPIAAVSRDLAGWLEQERGSNGS